MERYRLRAVAIVLVAGLALYWPATSSFALIVGDHGNRPIGNRGWPLCSEVVANLQTRVGYWAGGNGHWQFLYRSADAEEFNKAV